MKVNEQAKISGPKSESDIERCSTRPTLCATQRLLCLGFCLAFEDSVCESESK